MMRASRVLADNLALWGRQIANTTCEETAARLIKVRFHHYHNPKGDRALQQRVETTLHGTLQELHKKGNLGVASFSALLTVGTKARSGRLLREILRRIAEYRGRGMMVDLFLECSMLTASRFICCDYQSGCVYVDAVWAQRGTFTASSYFEYVVLLQGIASLLQTLRNSLSVASNGSPEQITIKENISIERSRGFEIYESAKFTLYPLKETIFEVYVQFVRNEGEVKAIVEDMIRLKVRPGRAFADAVVKMCVSLGDVTSARKHYVNAKRNNVDSVRQRNILVCELARLQRWQEFEEFWTSEMPGLDGLSNTDLAARLTFFLANNRATDAEALFHQYVCNKDLPLFPLPWRTMLQHYITIDDRQAAGDLALAYVSIGYPPDHALEHAFSVYTNGCSMRDLPRAPEYRPAFVKKRFEFDLKNLLPAGWLKEMEAAVAGTAKA